MSLEVLPLSVQKLVRGLQRKKRRDQHNLCFIEGHTLCREALQRKVPMDFAVIDEEGVHAAPDAPIRRQFEAAGVELYRVPSLAFGRMSDTNNPQGILAVLPIPAEAHDPKQSVVVLDRVADPGNVGTIIRTAVWFGFKQVLLGPGSADPFGPKTLRSAMGATFQINIKMTTSLPATLDNEFAHQERCGAVVGATTPLAEVDVTHGRPMSIILGNEAQGISPEVRAMLNQSYAIPGSGGLESLNVAAASAISLYHFAGLLSGEYSGAQSAGGS